MSQCLHCSTDLLSADEQFCCRGCETVYEMICGSGHEMFYNLKKDTPLTPLREKPFQEREWLWLEQKLELKADDQREGTQSLTLGISGLTCVACVWLVESVGNETDGILATNISITRGSIEIIYDPATVDLVAFADTLFKLGYELIPSVNKARTSSSLGIQLGVCGALAMNTMAFTLPRYTGMEASDELHELFTIIIIASSSLTFLIGGSYFFKRAWMGLKMKSIHMDLPISLGLLLAYFGSWFGWLFTHEGLFYFDFVAVFTFLMLLGKQVQNVSLSKANAKFSSENTIPEHYRDEQGTEIQTSEISQDCVLEIPAGTVVPASARLHSEAAECSLAWITGEPTTSLYKKSDPLPAGAVNQSQGSILVQTVEAVDPDQWSDKLSNREEQAHPLLERFIRYYLVCVLIAGVAAAVVWGWGLQQPLKALQVAISVFVVSCPCGIGLALPLLDTRFSRLASEIGVFPLKAAFWGGFRRLSRVVFDKTGTLTLDRPSLVNVEDLENLADEQKQVLFSLTRKSLHPLSRSLFAALVQAGTTHSSIAADVEEVAGLGLLAEYDGHKYGLIRPEQKEGLSCEFKCDDQSLVVFKFNESPREHTAESISILQRVLPQAPIILSGDQEQSVAQMAERLGIDEFRAELKPEEKLAEMEELQQKGDIFYIGDGINDIPAMREARLSAAPFANLNLVTNDVDMVFTDETLVFLPRLLRLAQIRQSISRQLTFYTLAYNFIVVAIACMGFMSPLIAAIIMPLSSLVSIVIVSQGVKTSTVRLNQKT